MKVTSDCFQTENLRELIDCTNFVFIGAGAGLSGAAGLLYFDLPTFQSWFPGYHEKYGLDYIYEAAFFDFPSKEEFYAYWARHISTIRYRYPSGEPYLKLYELIKHKNYFVITTNVDGQFEKSGFDAERIYTPQGDYAFFQCEKPCSQDLYYNRDMVYSMLTGLTRDSFSIPKEKIPHCPRCGRLLIPNLRKDNRFVEEPWMKKQADLNHFLEKSRTKNLLLLELGVGFSTPSIIRYPFEQIAAEMENSVLFRINKDDVRKTIELPDKRFISLKMDIKDFLAGL